jgi:hypothetical protein
MRKENMSLIDKYMGEATGKRTSKKTMSPQDALNKMTYTSQRGWEGTVYTISDQRFPEYNGKKILVKLVQGKNVFSWVD